MKNFIELFVDARAVSTPLIAVRTFDPASTIRNVRKALDNEHAKDKNYSDATNTPLISWDAIHGLRGIGEANGPGAAALNQMAQLADIMLATTVDLATALGVLEYATENVIAFIHNPHLVWEQDKRTIQGIWNLRDGYKANGNMAVILVDVGATLPAELNQDTLILDEPLPTRDELKTIITDTFNYAAQEDKYKACKNAATPAIVKEAVEALVGLPAFPAEQATAMSLDKISGKLDIEQCWDRKRTIVSTQGMEFHQPKDILKDMYGNEGFAKFATRLMEGEFAPNVILRVDEGEKQFAGNGTDSSGSTGKLLSEFLSWIEDNKVIFTLLLGVPGSSKSWSTWCLAGQYKKPFIKFNVAAMESKYVGEGHRILRENERKVEAISDKKIWLIMTANSLNGVPPELISRAQRGGIFFFDVPSEQEKIGIMKLKIARYGLDANQPLPEMNGWTGRDIDNCAARSQMLGVSLVDAGKTIVPLMTSHRQEMEELREYATGRFLSASHEGIYQKTDVPQSQKNVIQPVVNAGRKIR
ncbi:MAG: hypothetical protein C5B59_07080 [Bacteroidetes bacterium]|nr:MAG: hypothetical protein C5B59_07080 [Bacteroidota bacterium]